MFAFRGARRLRQAVFMDLTPLGLSPDFVSAFVQVVLIDLTLAGDNAVVIGLAAAGVPREKRGAAIAVGILAATVLRIIFALLTTTLLSIVGLLLAGGILLLWVCWKMWRELARPQHMDRGADVLAGEKPSGAEPKAKSLSAAIVQIVIADISMSLDNVLAVAGAAHEHPSVLVFGLALSIMLMGFAATFIARLLERHHWIAYIGLAIIFLVAVEMIWRGGHEVWNASGAEITENGIEFGDAPPH
ncbi:MAG: TerC family protein [Bryobacterales bacterium]